MRYLKAITRSVSTLAFLVCLTAIPAYADQFEKAKTAYQKGDYATAIKLLQPLAEKGHVEAQAALGLMYLTGRGVPQELLEASKWFRKAADQGHLLAQSNLGLMYLHGQGVPQDYQKAQKYLGKAANEGDPLGQFGLGLMYLGGEGVSRDWVKALMWLTLASESTGSTAFTKHRDNLASKMTPDQIAKAQRMAKEWKPRSEQ